MRFKAILLIGLITLSLFFKVNSSYAAVTNINASEGQNQYLLRNQLGTGSLGSLKFGAATTSSWTSKIGFKYIPTTSHFLCQVDVSLSTTGNPTDSVQMQIYSGGSGMDNGSLVATSANVWLGTDLSNSFQRASYWFGTQSPPGNCFGVKAGNTYWITMSRTGAADDSKLYNYQFTSNAPSDTCLGWTKSFGQVTSSTPYCNADIFGISDGSSIDALANANPCVDNLLYSTCTLFYTLFIPNFSTSNMTTKIASVSATLNTKAPFAYLNALSSIDFSPPASGSPTWSLPVQVGTGSGSIDTNLSFTPTGGYAVFFSQVRTVTTFMVWLGFFSYIFFLIRRVTTT